MQAVSSLSLCLCLCVSVSLFVGDFPNFQLSYCEVSILLVSEHVCTSTINWDIITSLFCI